MGGTSLSVTRSGQWSNEVGWAGSGGGYSQAFAEPSYQQNDGFSGNNGCPHQSRRRRRRRPVHRRGRLRPLRLRHRDSLGQVGGTSVAAPLWAGMAAIADQGRVLAGGQPLGATQILTDLYWPRPRRLPRHHPGQQRLPRRPRLRPGHRPGLAQGQPPHPRPGRRRPGQRGGHRHPAAAQRRPRRQLRHHRLGRKIPSASPTSATTAPPPSRWPAARPGPPSRR